MGIQRPLQKLPESGDRLTLESFLDLYGSIVVAPRQQEHVCQVETRLSIILIVFDRGLKLPLGLGKLAPGQKRRAQVVVRGPRLRREPSEIQSETSEAGEETTTVRRWKAASTFDTR